MVGQITVNQAIKDRFQSIRLKAFAAYNRLAGGRYGVLVCEGEGRRKKGVPREARRYGVAQRKFKNGLLDFSAPLFLRVSPFLRAPLWNPFSPPNSYYIFTSFITTVRSFIFINPKYTPEGVSLPESACPSHSIFCSGTPVDKLKIYTNRPFRS